MKKCFSTSLFILVVSFCYSQNLNDLYSGSWSTINPNKTTLICSSISNNLVYRIGNGNYVPDGVIEEYEIIVDGVKLSTRFLEAGGVIVEGKKIEIRQIGVSTITRGFWEVIQKTKFLYSKNSWTAYPSLDKAVLVAELKVAQEFNLAFDIPGNTCSSALFEVFVDGVVVKDNDGRIVQFAAGSNFMGKGKRITIKASGSCTPNFFLSGTISIKQVP